MCMCRVLSGLVVSVNVSHTCGLGIRIEMYGVVANVNLEVTALGLWLQPKAAACFCSSLQQPWRGFSAEFLLKK